MSYTYPVMPQTPDLLGADDLVEEENFMEEETQAGTSETPTGPAADTGGPRKHPQDTTPRGNPPTDHEAVAKGEEILGRVKAY